MDGRKWPGRKSELVLMVDQDPKLGDRSFSSNGLQYYLLEWGFSGRNGLVLFVFMG